MKKTPKAGTQPDMVPVSARKGTYEEAKKGGEALAKTKPKAKKTSKKSKVINAEAKVELVTFSIRATVPTMMYGNIMPEIVVKAPNIEMAKAYAMPFIEEMFDTYSQTSLTKKESVTVTEKHVDVSPVAPVTPAPKVEAPVEAPKEEEKKPEAPNGPAVKTDPYLKAENAVASAQSIEALNLTEEKIKNSTKINPEDKPFLYTLILKKKSTIK